MDKLEKFFIKISSRNRKWSRLREKERLYAKLIQVPSCINECGDLKEEINYLRNELNINEI